jgi:hypothetical protein
MPQIKSRRKKSPKRILALTLESIQLREDH